MLCAAVGGGAAQVVKVLQGSADVGIAFNVSCIGNAGEFNLGHGRKKLLDLKNRCEFGLVHVDRHPSMINPIPLNRYQRSSGSFFVGNAGFA